MEGNGEKKNTFYCEGGKNIQVWEEEAGLLSRNRHVWGVWEGEWVLLHTYSYNRRWGGCWVGHLSYCTIVILILLLSSSYWKNESRLLIDRFCSLHSVMLIHLSKSPKENPSKLPPRTSDWIHNPAVKDTKALTCPGFACGGKNKEAQTHTSTSQWSVNRRG